MDAAEPRLSEAFTGGSDWVCSPVTNETEEKPIGWRKDRGGRDAPEIRGGNGPEATGLLEGVEEPRCEGQHEAAARKGAAGPGQSSPGGEEEEDFDGDEYRVETTDEFYCGYDSTWETEEGPSTSKRQPAASMRYKFSRFENAARDMQNYRHDYPLMQDPWNPIFTSVQKPNLRFYLGERPSLPDGVYIDTFHNRWKGDYELLEDVHTFIQWLFPLQEPGMNHEASIMTKEEINEFRKSNTAMENLLKSYELMLDFYGIQLCDKKTGEVKRAPNWRERFHNLNFHTHNNLRITRILKCLGTLGYPHYQAPLVRFFLTETLVHGELQNIKDSVLNYFMFAVRDKKQRRNLIKFAYLQYTPKDEFVWCPRKVQMMWSGPSVSKP